jgi:hypothetical protein
LRQAAFTIQNEANAFTFENWIQDTKVFNTNSTDFISFIQISLFNDKNGNAKSILPILSCVRKKMFLKGIISEGNLSVVANLILW